MAQFLGRATANWLRRWFNTAFNNVAIARYGVSEARFWIDTKREMEKNTLRDTRQGTRHDYCEASPWVEFWRVVGMWCLMCARFRGKEGDR